MSRHRYYIDTENLSLYNDNRLIKCRYGQYTIRKDKRLKLTDMTGQ